MNRREAIIVFGTAVSRALKAGGPAYHFEIMPGKVRITAGGSEYTSLYYSPEYDRPFLNPLVTPSGVVISRGVPPNAGETSDHAWHRGLWYAHGDISGADFWREKVDKETGRKTTGRIVATGAPMVDAEHASVTLRCALTAADGKVLGTNRQRFRFSSTGGANIIDVSIALIADGGIGLVMGDSDDGGLAIRLTDEFRFDKGATLTNSEGLNGIELWGKPARWVDFSGTKNGKNAGAALMDHPGNLRYPTRWHARDYGLNSANAFAEGSFTRSKQDKSAPTEGQYTIAKGSSLQLDYRLVLHDGDAQQAGIDNLHKQFAKTKADRIV